MAPTQSAGLTMDGPFATMGLVMLAALAALIVSTGFPVWALLIGTGSAFAAAGWALGMMDASVLSAISGRTLGLLEHDLLQALPLYVFVGVLLQHLSVADALFAALARLLRPSGAGSALAAFGVGALVAPMNGSVASSSALVARLVAPRLGGLEPARATALISASATIGVVVPPSLVLILLGDAMMRAHIEASNLPGYMLAGQRIINTQDVFHAALLPAALVLALWVGVAWWHTRSPAAQGSCERVSPRQWWLAMALLAGVAILLAGVFTGQILPVEGAATAAMVLVTATLLSGALCRHQWRTVLMETLNLSGALIALLVGASTFSLVFRLWGTDLWMTHTILGSALPAYGTAALVLLLVAVCAWVLDAFEMIFVIVPTVAPPLIVCLGDAQLTAVLLLLVLQLGFLIPPMGYAVMMARTRSGLPHRPTRETLEALLPYLAVQALVIAAVFVAPRAVHYLDASPPASVPEAPVSNAEVEQMMRDMSSDDAPKGQ